MTLNNKSVLFNYETANTGTVDIAGDFAFTGTSVTKLFSANADVGTFDIDSSWTGKFTLSSSYTADAIKTALIDSGATLDGTDIDNTNISQFDISDGSFSLVPEPSSTGLLFALVGLALGFRRRK